MKIGDWVYSYSKGIWQITRIEEVEDVFSDESSQIVVHCKRFLNSSYKKSITSESCSAYFISLLPANEIEKVRGIIRLKPNWYKEFEEYHNDVSSILNLTFYVLNAKERNDLKNSILEKCNHLAFGLKDTEILSLLVDELEMNRRSSIRNFTAQFVSPNSQVKNKKLIYTELEFMDF